MVVAAVAEEASGKACKITVVSGCDDSRVEVTAGNVSVDIGESGCTVEFRH